jgi:hypothetical protein
VARTPEARRHVSVVDMLAVLVRSTLAVEAFYHWRDTEKDDPGTRPRVRDLVATEIENRRRAAELCGMDPSFGFHPEAAAFLFDERAIREGIQELQGLLTQLGRHD